MTSPARINANRQNAAKSTGPRTPAGKARATLNALKTGLHARLAVVPALGETPEAFEAFAAAVAASLGPVGPVEEELAGRVAVLMWRLRRVARFEAAAACPPAGLPPHPDDVAPADTATCLSPPPDAPLAAHLAYTRFGLRSTRYALEAADRAAVVLGPSADREPTPECDDPLDWRVSDLITRVAATLLGWPATVRATPWVPSAREAGAAVDPGGGIVWTAPTLRAAVDLAAKAAGREAAEFRAEVRAGLAAERDHLAVRVASREAAERDLSDRLLAERTRAAAAGLFGDQRVLERIIKAEAHFGRELDRALALLDRLQAPRRGRPDPGGDEVGSGVRGVRTADPPPGPVGFVLPNRLSAARGGSGTPAELPEWPGRGDRILAIRPG